MVWVFSSALAFAAADCAQFCSQYLTIAGKAPTALSPPMIYLMRAPMVSAMTRLAQDMKADFLQ
jgi:hypothetical protein